MDFFSFVLRERKHKFKIWFWGWTAEGGWEGASGLLLMPAIENVT